MDLNSEIGRAVIDKHTAEMNAKRRTPYDYEVLLADELAAERARRIHTAAVKLVLTTQSTERQIKCLPSCYMVDYDASFPLRNPTPSPFDSLELHLKAGTVAHLPGFRPGPADIPLVEVGIVATNAEGTSELTFGSTIDTKTTTLGSNDRLRLVSDIAVLSLIWEADSLRAGALRTG